jgi:hypothetical protein
MADRVIVLDETERQFYTPEGCEGKVICVPFDHRPTYQDFFDLAKDYPNDVNAIINSDIYFDDLSPLANITTQQCYALTRWEHTADGQLTDFESANRQPAEWSQDAWVFRGVPRVTGCDWVQANNQKTGERSKIPFTMGVPGCDNHIAWLLKNKFHYNVLNPCKRIKACHYHTEEARDYGTDYRITGDAHTQWGNLQQIPPS